MKPLVISSSGGYGRKQIFFHNAGSTYKTVTKYDGTTVIDKEMAVDGLTMNRAIFVVLINVLRVGTRILN